MLLLDTDDRVYACCGSCASTTRKTTTITMEEMSFSPLISAVVSLHTLNDRNNDVCLSESCLLLLLLLLFLSLPTTKRTRVAVFSVIQMIMMMRALLVLFIVFFFFSFNWERRKRATQTKISLNRSNRATEKKEWTTELINDCSFTSRLGMLDFLKERREKNVIPLFTMHAKTYQNKNEFLNAEKEREGEFTS